MATTRHSPNREAILACLRQTHAHPSADAIYAALHGAGSRVSRATVYRNLAQLREAGQIVSVGSVAGAERYDAVTEPHPHFVCDCCHRVADVDLRVPPALCAQAAAALGARIDASWLMFSGLCADCIAKF